jgi:S-adenosylmethionine decarboxylase
MMNERQLEESEGAWMEGVEWIVEAHGCSPVDLRDLPVMRSLFAALIRDLDLRTVGEPLWHQFPSTGGITGLALLSESHLACHTFPEHKSICLNLFSCRPHPQWDFDVRLRQLLGAKHVNVRVVTRDYVGSNHAAAWSKGVGEHLR